MLGRGQKLKLIFSFSPLPRIRGCVVGGEELKALKTQIEKFFFIKPLYLGTYVQENNSSLNRCTIMEYQALHTKILNP